MVGWLDLGGADRTTDDRAADVEKICFADGGTNTAGQVQPQMSVLFLTYNRMLDYETRDMFRCSEAAPES